MTDDSGADAARDQYAAAYSTHYTRKDLHRALGLYRRIILAYPRAQEAEFSRSQIENIVRIVVPRDVLHDAHVALALAHFQDPEQTGATSARSTIIRDSADSGINEGQGAQDGRQRDSI